VIGFRQQLSTTSFEAFELEITVNYSIILCTLGQRWQFHAKSHELVSAFWLVLLTELEILHCYATNAVNRCLQYADNCTRLAESLQQTVDASKFPTQLSSNSLNSLRAPYCIDGLCFLIRIASSFEHFHGFI